MIKKKFSFFIIFTFLFSCNSYSVQDQELANEVFSFLDSIEFDSNAPMPMYEKEPYTAYTALKALTRSCPTDEESIIDAQKILREDLYLYTHPLNQRSILDMPQFYFPSYRDFLRCEEQPWQLSYHLFFNETPSCFFTQTNKTINSYLALDNPIFVNSIDELGFDFNLLTLFAILGKTRVTEYRTGLMIGSQFKNECWLVEWRTPIEYLLRHFDLTQSEQDDLHRELNAEGDEESELDFAQEHLIADRVGMGDMRLDVGYLSVDHPLLTVHSGIEMTFPFAWAFKKGLFGSHFRKNKPAPILDLVNLLNLLNTDIIQAQNIGNDFLLAALDRLSRILLETGLGNNGHVGLGPMVLADMRVRKKLHFKTRGVLEYLFPAKEKRFYIEKKNIAAFDAILPPDPTNCDAALKFLEEQLVETLFPTAFTTRIWPGFLVKITTALTGNIAKNWKMTLAYDFWYQQKERLGQIEAPEALQSVLRKNLAQRPSAFQNKIYGSLGYSWPHERVDLALSLHGDITFLSSGIGRDFNIGLCVELLL